jgi:hypothetical protein
VPRKDRKDGQWVVSSLRRDSALHADPLGQQHPCYILYKSTRSPWLPAPYVYMDMLDYMYVCVCSAKCAVLYGSQSVLIIAVSTGRYCLRAFGGVALAVVVEIAGMGWVDSL